MTAFLAYTIAGIATGSIYALTASGLVVTYTTSGIFNFAHGAIGMVMAFTYWELSVHRHWPQLLALITVLFVIAPLTGIIIERLLMRPLSGAPVFISLVVTLGLLLTLIGIATIIWKPQVPRVVPEFFVGHQVRLFGALNVSFHQLTTMGVAVLVAIFLRLLFYRTRLGIAMRAVVDDPELAALNGAAPARVSAYSWALGSMLAGLAGILLAPIVTLDIIILTLLVINGYAAAMLGRLKSLPLTFAGGLLLGLFESYVTGYAPNNLLSHVKPVLPIFFLFVILVTLPQARLRAGRPNAGLTTPRVPAFRESLIAAGAFIAGGFVVSGFLHGQSLFTASSGISLGLIMLSLVVLTGYSGQVSLCQLTFVGLGAFAMGKFFGGASPLGIVAAVLIAAAAGALIALPALRLQGLYLALATLAFAQLMTVVFFKDNRVFGYGGSLPVGRIHVPGISLRGDRAMLMFLIVAFAFASVGVLALRRSPFGRRLVALKDSPAACATLGLNLTGTKLMIFAISAGLAGFAGALYGGLRGRVSSNDFEMLYSLVLLLLVSVSGINTPVGALMAGLSFALFGVLQQHVPSLGQVTYLGAGLGAIGLGKNMNGWTSQFAAVGDSVRGIFRRRGAPAPEFEIGEGVTELARTAG